MLELAERGASKICGGSVSHSRLIDSIIKNRVSNSSKFNIQFCREPSSLIVREFGCLWNEVDSSEGEGDGDGQFPAFIHDLIRQTQPRDSDVCGVGSLQLMQVDDETDGLDVEDEFMSAVSCMSSPTSTGGGVVRPPSGKAMDVHSQSQHHLQHPSTSATARLASYQNSDWDEDEDEETIGRNDERCKLLQNNNEKQQLLLHSAPYSSPSLAACASELLPLKSRLSSPPELIVEDHSRVGGKRDLSTADDEQGLPSSSSLHLGIPSGNKRSGHHPRRSSSGSNISVASTVSSNRSSYRSALEDATRSSLVNGSLKNYPLEENGTINDSKMGLSKTTRTCISPSYCAFDEWHPAYLHPPAVSHPLHENMLLSLLGTCLHYACGLCIGVPLAVFLLAWTCLVVPFRLLFYLATRLTIRGLCRWLWRREHCDPLWPLGGGRDLASGEEDFGDTTLLLATTQGGSVDTSKLRQLVWRRLINLKDSNGYLSYAKLSSKLRRASDDCYDGGCCTAVWTQDARFDVKTHVTSTSCSEPGMDIEVLRDVETYINRLLYDPACALNRKKPLWGVKALTDFGGSGSSTETQCTLLIIRLHSAITDGCVCPLKYLTLVSDGQLSFDCEPKMRGDDWPPFNLFITASFHLWHAFSIVAAGPMSFLMTACRRAQNPVWALSVGGDARKSTEDAETGGAGGDRKCRGRRLKATWVRVPQADQLMKLERILRCSIQELLLAFVAGALRRHFRSRGIKHPPDLCTSVPVTFRDYMPVGRTFPCHFVLTPVELPLSVDGTIPRIWETQRRLCESLDSAYPRTARCLMRNAGASLPKSWLRALMASTHRASDGFVCFWRASGELSLADRPIHSLLIYPPLKRPSLFSSQKSWSKYAFSFVQTGNEIVLSLVVDQTAFGADPDALLRQFQYEIHGLLAHMSTRMLTLSQATFLPSPLLITRLARSPLKIVHQATAVAGEHGEDVQDEEQSSASADSETLEELEQLMMTVQNELQAMKTNPRGNRGDYIAKLAELETKMESFHQNIVDKLQRKEQSRRRASVVSEGGQRRYCLDLGTSSPRRASSSSGVLTTDDENKALLDPNFESLLQPLRADVDGLMTQEAREGAMKLRRKRSRRLDSPTRLSPRCAAGDSGKEQQPPQRQRYYSTPPSSGVL